MPAFKGSISFGMVYIPISLHLAVKNNDISFNMLHKKYQSRIQYKKTCPECQEDVETSDIVKGYQYAKDKYVIIEDEDFEKIKTKKDKTITIEQFVELAEIDPVYYDKAYYVKPEGAERAFYLLKEAMETENKVGIAKTVLGNKETLIAIRVDKGQLMLSTLYFYDEIQKNPIKEKEIDLAEKEIALAKTIINNMSSEFKPESYKDEYRERLIASIEAKINGQEIITPKEPKENKIADLMEALQASINLTKHNSEHAHAGLN